MFFVKFTYFDRVPVVIGAQIRGKEEGAKALFTDIQYNPIWDDLGGSGGYEYPTEKIKAALTDQGFIQVDFDATDIGEKYNFLNIAAIAPAKWLGDYKKRIEQ